MKGRSPQAVSRIVRFKIVVAAVLLVLPCLKAPACLADEAQAKNDLTDLSLEQLMEVEVATVYGASKFEQKVSEAPASVSVVTADEIKRLGYRTLADLIGGQRGFYATYDRNYTYTAFRGVDHQGGYDTRVLILVDGHRTNDNMYDSAFTGNDFLLDTDLIERVEVIRGPGSSLYGDNAFFAVINVITRHNQSLEGVEASAEAASRETYKGRLSYGKKFVSGAALSLSGSVFDSVGNKDLFFPEFNTPAQNNGVAHDLDYERAYSVFGTYSLKDFTIQGAYATRTKAVPTASFQATFDTKPFFTVDSRGYLDAKYDHTFESGWEGMARLFYDYYDYYEKIPQGDPPITNRDSAQNQWWGAELKVSKTFLEQHLIVAGTEFQDNLVQKFENHDISPYHQYLNLDNTTWRWASYLQDEFTLSPKWVLNAGIRYDYYSTFGSTVNPRAAVIYSPFTPTKLKAVYGEAFRAPNNYELFYGVPDLGQKGNPALKPEKIRTGELIWEQLLDRHFRSTASFFYSKISKMIVQVTDPADSLGFFANASSVTTKGVEAEVEGKWRTGLLVRGSYTYQDAYDDTTGSPLTDSPKHLAKVHLIVPLLPEKVFSGLEVRYMSRRQTLAGDHVGGFLTTNLTLFSHNLVKGLEVSGSVYNLFDKRYADPAGSQDFKEDTIQQDGRLFRLKITYNF